jgi:predicted small lipoprotein YifL
MNRWFFPVAAAILLAVLFAGCGKKGPLVPPLSGKSVFELQEAGGITTTGG